MSGGNILAILGGLGAVATILGLFGVKIDGRSAIARLWAWVQRPRKEREAMVARIGELEKQAVILNGLRKTERTIREDAEDKLKQGIAELEQRVTSREQMLIEARDQITDIRNVIAGLPKPDEEKISTMDYRLHVVELRVDSMIAELGIDNT